MRRKLDEVPADIGESHDATIRVMNEGMDDLELLRRLDNEAFSEHFDHRDSTLEEWQHECSHPDFDRHGWFFATLDGEPVGHVGTWIDRKFVKFKGIQRGWIATIGVLKPHRRKGIGTALILRGMAYLKSRGMSEAELGVDDLNQTEAIRLYKRVGFSVVRKELTYQKKLH
jgi:mycothiol synthase